MYDMWQRGALLVVFGWIGLFVCYRFLKRKVADPQETENTKDEANTDTEVSKEEQSEDKSSESQEKTEDQISDEDEVSADLSSTIEVKEGSNAVAASDADINQETDENTNEEKMPESDDRNKDEETVGQIQPSQETDESIEEKHEGAEDVEESTHDAKKDEVDADVVEKSSDLVEREQTADQEPMAIENNPEVLELAEPEIKENENPPEPDMVENVELADGAQQENEDIDNAKTTEVDSTKEEVEETAEKTDPGKEGNSDSKEKSALTPEEDAVGDATATGDNQDVVSEQAETAPKSDAAENGLSELEVGTDDKPVGKEDN